jgi:flavin-dependent dehydrogenase
MVAPQGYVGMVRTEDGLLNVAAALKRSALTESGSPAELIRTVLAQAGGPALEGEVLEGWKGTPALGYRPYRLGGRRILAVGDAAGFVEPFTGEGMGWALAGARALAPLVQEAVEGWNHEVPRRWEEIYARTVLPAQRLSRTMAWTLGRPLSARILLELLNHLPGMAGPFVRRAANPPSLHAVPAGRTH